MYILLLLVLVLLILLYYLLDNLNLILNLFIVDLSEQKASKEKKVKKLSTKNLKKLEKQEPTKVDLIQRYLNFTTWMGIVKTNWVELIQARFTTLKDQVDHSLQDASHVLNSVQIFFENLYASGDTQNRKRVESKKSKSVGSTKQKNDGKVSKVETKKKIETENVKQKTQVKTKVASKEEKKIVERQEEGKVKNKVNATDTNVKQNEKTPPQKSKKLSSATEVKKDPEIKADLKKTSKAKKTKDGDNSLDGGNAKIVDPNKKEENKVKERGKGNVTVNKEKNKKLNVVKEQTTKIVQEENDDEREWTNVETKPVKASGNKNAIASSSDEKKIKNVITIQKNSKDKKEITIEENEKSGVKTVLVKKTKQTVYKQTEKVAEKKSGNTKDNDQSIGSLTFEELERLVKTFSSKGQDKTDNIIEIIQQVQNFNNKIDDIVETEKEKEFEIVKQPTKDKMIKNLQSKTVGFIGSKTLEEAKELAKNDTIDREINMQAEVPKRQRKKSKSSGDLKKNQDVENKSDKNTDSLDKSQVKSVEMDPVKDKLEKIKNHDFDQIGKLSFDELGKIVNALVSENLVPVPKFSDPPFRKTRKNGANENKSKSSQSNEDLKKFNKASAPSDLSHGKKDKVIEPPVDQRKSKNKDQTKSQETQPTKKKVKESIEKVAAVEQTSESEIKTNDQFNNSISKTNEIPSIHKVASFPKIQENYFGDPRDESNLPQTLTQQTDYLNQKDNRNSYDTSGLSQEMILCEEIAVKRISALLEDDNEIETNTTAVSEPSETFWSIQETTTQCDIRDGTNSFGHEHVAKFVLSHETIDLNPSQNISYESGHTLSIEEIRKAVVEELKENFENAAEKQQNESSNEGLENLIQQSDNSFNEHINTSRFADHETSISCVQNSFTEEVLISHTESEKDIKICENFVFEDMVETNIEKSVEFLESVEEIKETVSNIIEIAVQNEESPRETVGTDLQARETPIPLQETPSDITENISNESDVDNERSEMVSNDIGNIHDNQDTSVKSNNGVNDQDSTMFEKTKHELNHSETTASSKPEFNIAPNEDQFTSSEFQAEVIEDQPASFPEVVVNVLEKEPVHIESNPEGENATSEISNSAIPQETSPELTDTSEGGSSASERVKPANPVRRQFIRPVIKIDRCGDNDEKIEEVNNETPPSPVKER